MKLPITRPARTGDLHQTWPGKRWWQKPGPWCRTKGRLGRRGAMMILLGATYVLIGYGDATRPAPDVAGAWHLQVDSHIRGIAWAVTGLVAVVFALVRPHSTPPGVAPEFWRTDTPGWLALYVVPVLVITSYGGSWALWTLTDQAQVPAVGDPMAWYNAVLRVPFVLIVLICSGWVENPRRGDCA